VPDRSPRSHHFAPPAQHRTTSHLSPPRWSLASAFAGGMYGTCLVSLPGCCFTLPPHLTPVSSRVPVMKRQLFVGTLLLSSLWSAPGFGFDLLNRMLGSNGCGCELSCCEVTSCAKPAPTCGCEPAPTCGCEPEPTCAAEEPACGLEEPSCGLETSCCQPRCRLPLLNNLRGLLACRPCRPAMSCVTEPTCEAPACCEATPTCGCEGPSRPVCRPKMIHRLFKKPCCAAPTCGCDEGPTCGVEPDCGNTAPVAPAVPAAPQPTADAAA
jgi:hypothetical protein